MCPRIRLVQKEEREWCSVNMCNEIPFYQKNGIDSLRDVLLSINLLTLMVK